LEVAADVGLVPCPCESELRWTLARDFAQLPPPRLADTNKGTFGHVSIIAGSLGYHGAAVLASHGALRAQPGLVTIIPQNPVYVPIAAQSQAAMVQPWQAGAHLPASSTAALFGPGMAAADIPQILKDDMARLWKTSALAVVADASGLLWLKRGPVQEKAIRVMTPHPGEAARVLDVPLREVVADRVGSLRELSKRYGDCLVVLKGYQTLVGRSAGPIYINSSGNPWLAQGGSGDLLGGFLSGLLAQPAWQKDPLLTVCFAVWQHGAVADHLAATQPNWTIEDLARIIGTVRPA
jgi:NAD(P)H-hydrate epimerase